MPNFRYRGRSARGDLITGRLEAETVDGVATRLLKLGVTPLAIAAESARDTRVQDLLQHLGARRPTKADLVLFEGKCTRSPSPDCRYCAACAGWRSRLTT